MNTRPPSAHEVLADLERRLTDPAIRRIDAMVMEQAITVIKELLPRDTTSAREQLIKDLAALEFPCQSECLVELGRRAAELV